MQEVSLYNGEVLLRFNPDSHSYYVKDMGKGEDRFRRVGGVTSKLESLYDQSALKDWAMGLASQTIIKEIGGSKYEKQLTKAFLDIYFKRLPSVPANAAVSTTLHDLLLAYQKGMAAPRTKSDTAKDIGTTVHEAIDLFHKKNVERLQKIGDEEMDKMAELSFKRYLKWFKKSGLVVHESERAIYSRKYNYAGTLDRIFKDKDGKLIHSDFKTSNPSRSNPLGVYGKYWSQQGAYMDAYTEETGKQFADFTIVNSPKKGSLKVVTASSMGLSVGQAIQIWRADIKAFQNHQLLEEMLETAKSEA